jgi:hypothetical protein
MQNEVMKTKDQSSDKVAVERQASVDIPLELLDTLVAGCKTESDLFGPKGVFTQPKVGADEAPSRGGDGQPSRL